jgi:uncharacterized membrane protein YraQ (UPF0718 family)
MPYVIPFVDWTNGAVMMTLIFGLVITGLVGFVIYFINSETKKAQEKKNKKT